jgi:multiple antibiotic resistance protein
MDARAFGETLVTLLVIMDPVGGAPIFLAVTAGLDPATRRRAALRAVAAAAALVFGFAIFGGLVLRYLHVSIESLSIAGGLVLLLVSLEMLRGQDYPTGPSEDVAIVPLATPLLAGPGTIATVIVLMRQNEDASSRAGVVLGIAVAIIVVGLTLLAAERVAHIIPGSVMSFLVRVFGLLLAAISVQLIVDGVRGLLGS